MIGQAATVADQVDELNNMLPDLLADTTLRVALELLAVIRGARVQLAELEAIAERHAAQAMSKARYEQDGIFAFRRRKQKSTTWFVDDTAHAVVHAAAVDPETGEVMPDDAKPWVERAISSLLNCAGIGYFRTEQLKALGIDPDEYRTSLPGGYSVEVRIAGEEAAA